MAIRPTDLQNAIWQTVQNQPLGQRAEEGPRQLQIAAQAAFVAQTEERNESIAEAGDLRGNRIEVGDRQADRDQQQGRRRERRPGQAEAEAPATDPDEPPHLIDFMA